MEIVSTAVRTGACRVLVLGLMLCAAMGFVHPDRATAAPNEAAKSATMVFNGAVNVLGLLNGLNVSPSSVSIAAGGTVTFVNNSGVRLSVRAGDQRFSLANGASQSVRFLGAEQPRKADASVTPLDVPLVGSLLSSAGTIQIAPIPENGPKTGTSPTPSRPLSPSNRPSGSVAPSSPSTSPEGQESPAPSALPVRPPVQPTQRPESPSQEPRPRQPLAGSGSLSPSEEAVPDSSPTSAAPSGVPSETSARPTPRQSDSVLIDAAPAASSAPDTGVGLLPLVAMVLLGGVGAAAIRVMVAARRRT